MNEEIETRLSEIDGCLAMALDRIRALETMATHTGLHTTAIISSC